MRAIFYASSLQAVLCLTSFRSIFATRVLHDGDYYQPDGLCTIFGLPFLPLGNPSQSQENTTNTDYSANDISHVGHWSDFNLINILDHYGPLLAEARIQEERISGTPPHPINGKMGLEFRYAEYLQGRIIRALRSGFEQLVSHDLLKNQTIVSFGEGELVQSPDDSTPSDTAYFASNLPWSTRPNRLPGILKPS